MKLYVVVEKCYDYCNFWEDNLAYYLSEEKAYEHLLEIQEKYELDGLDPEQYTVDIREIETED